MSNLPIIKKIIDPPKSKHKNIHPNLPQPHAQVLMIMPCKCGKSTIGSNCILNNNLYGLNYFENTPIIISNTINTDLTNRFLKQSCVTYDRYDDQIINDFVSSQKKFGNVSKMPSSCLFVDDCLGDKTTALDNLSSRYRHSNIHLLMISTQLFRKVSPVIRANATNILIGKLQNAKELDKLDEEYGGMFNGQFRELYKKATKKKYNFLHLNLQENPSQAWRNFEEKLYPLNNISDSDSDSD
jgi:hypothetical protein